MTCRSCIVRFAVAFAVVAPGPALAAKTAQYSGRFAAKYPAVAEAGSIGMLGFYGPDDAAFTAVLTAALQSAEIDGRQVLEVKTLEGLNYRPSVSMSRSEIAAAIQLGQKLNVQAVFTGTITSASIASTNFTRTENVCLKPAGLFKCEVSGVQQVPCTKVTGQYAVTPRVIQVSNGSLIYSEAVSAQDEYTICNGQVQAESIGEAFSNLGSFFGAKKSGPGRASSPDEMLQRLRANVAAQIRQQVTPYNKTVTVTFRDEARDLPKPTQTRLKNALEFAQAGRLDRACSILQTMMDDTTQQNITLLYDLGVCQEALLPDEPSAALEYYAKADQLLDRPDKLVSDAYLRTKAMVSSQRSISRSMPSRGVSQPADAPAAPVSKPPMKAARKTSL